MGTGEWLPLPDLSPCGCVFLPRGNPGLASPTWEILGTLGTPKSFKIYFTPDAHQSKRSKRSQKHFWVSGCLRGILGVHKLILIWTINREPPPPTGSSPKRQADCAVRHLNQAVTIRQKSKVISNHYIQIPQIAGGFKHALCFLRHDPLTVLHVSRRFLFFLRFLRSQLGVRSLRDDFQTPRGK